MTLQSDWRLLQNAATATGNGTAFEVSGFGVVGMHVTFTDTAEITWEGLNQADGTTWVALAGVNVNTGVSGTTATVSGVYALDVRFVDLVRARVSSYTNGTVTVRALAKELASGGVSAGAGGGGGSAGALVTHTFQNAATATGNGTAMPVDTVTGVMVDLAISATATVTFEGAGEAGTYVAIDAFYMTSKQVSSTATASGLYFVNVAGLKTVRVRISAYTSGTVTATGRATTLMTPLLQAAILGAYSGNNFVALNGQGQNSDGFSSVNSLAVLGFQFGYTATNNWDRVRVATIVKDIASTAVTAGTPAAVWTPASGKKFRLLGWSLSLSVAGSIIFKYGAGNTTLFRTPAVAAAGITSNPPGFGNGTMPNAADDVLKVDVTASGNVAGHVFGIEE